MNFFREFAKMHSVEDIENDLAYATFKEFNNIFVNKILPLIIKDCLEKQVNDCKLTFRKPENNHIKLLWNKECFYFNLYGNYKEFLIYFSQIPGVKEAWESDMLNCYYITLKDMINYYYEELQRMEYEEATRKLK